MKTKITILALLVSTVFFAQTTDTISKVSIKSKVALNYSSRENKKDTIYISMTNWIYSPEKSAAIGLLKEYVKTGNTFKEIGKSNVRFTKAEINNAFTALNVTVIPTDKFHLFFEDFLVKSLLKEIKKTIDAEGKTIYGGIPNNWAIFNQ